MPQSTCGRSRQVATSDDSFSGDLSLRATIVISTRHSRFGSDRFREGIAAAIGQLSDYRTLEAQRISQLQARELPDRAAESIVFRAWEQGFVGTRLLRPPLDEWRHPTFDEFEARTAWSMLAAFTHVVKERQRRYPTKAAWEVMQFQAILAA